MRKLTNEEYIAKAKSKHGQTYDYSRTSYINADSLVDIVCKQHGIFQQRADHHLSGSGCPRCKFEKAGMRQRSTLEDFVDKARKRHRGFYTYEKSNYVSAKQKVTITCPLHGDFEQTPDNHLSGSGCDTCGYLRNMANLRSHFDTERDAFVRKAKEVQAFEYDYSLVEYNGNKKKVKIICSNHGVFEQSPTNHLMGKSCPLCKAYSKGEILISKILIQSNIPFVYQKAFSDFRNSLTGKPYRFDFYLPEVDTLIEYDGRQHFESIDMWGGEPYLEQVQKVDNLKNKYCSDNGIRLVRISYKEKVTTKLKECGIIK